MSPLVKSEKTASFSTKRSHFSKSFDSKLIITLKQFVYDFQFTLTGWLCSNPILLGDGAIDEENPDNDVVIKEKALQLNGLVAAFTLVIEKGDKTVEEPCQPEHDDEGVAHQAPAGLRVGQPGQSVHHRVQIR